MQIVGLLLALVFGAVGYREARRFQQEHGRPPWGWDPWVWAAVVFVSFVIGAILITIAKRQDRKRAAAAQAWSFGVGPHFTPVYPAGVVAPVAEYAAQPVAAAVAAAEPVAASAAAASVGAAAAALPPAHWAADPTGRHHYRWWDGSAWTANVATNGISALDAI